MNGIGNFYVAQQQKGRDECQCPDRNNGPCTSRGIILLDKTARNRKEQTIIQTERAQNNTAEFLLLTFETLKNSTTGF